MIIYPFSFKKVDNGGEQHKNSVSERKHETDQDHAKRSTRAAATPTAATTAAAHGAAAAKRGADQGNQAGFHSNTRCDDRKTFRSTFRLRSCSRAFANPPCCGWTGMLYCCARYFVLISFRSLFLRVLSSTPVARTMTTHHVIRVARRILYTQDSTALRGRNVHPPVLLSVRTGGNIYRGRAQIQNRRCFCGFAPKVEPTS